MEGHVAFAAENPGGDAGGDDLLQHVHGRFVEAEIFHRSRDFSLLDRKGAVSGESGTDAMLSTAARAAEVASSVCRNALWSFASSTYSAAKSRVISVDSLAQ